MSKASSKTDHNSTFQELVELFKPETHNNDAYFKIKKQYRQKGQVSQ